MKVAIPTNDGIHIISDSGKIEGFMIFEINEGTIKHEQLVANLSSQIPDHEYGHSEEDDDKNLCPMMRAITDCQVVISNGVSKKLFEDLLIAEKEVYITEADDVRSAIRNYLRMNRNLKSGIFANL